MPYPDELVGSIVARFLVHTGLPLRLALLRLLGRRKDGISSFLPAELESIGRALDMSPRDVLWRHTIFPYSTAFMTSEQTRSFALKMVSAEAQGRPAHVTLIQSVTQGRPNLRFCPLCVGEDIRRFGESYWHRAHCLPGVQACPIHRCPLCRPDTAYNASGRAVLEPLPQRQPRRLERWTAPASLTLALADASAATLEEALTRTGRWRSQLRASAVARGYVLPGGQVATARLSADLRAAFGPRFLADLNCDYTNYPLAWPALLVRESVREPLSPLRHLLLTTFLERQSLARGLTAFNYRPPGKTPRDRGVLDRELAATVARRVKQLRLIGQRATVQQLFDSTGLWSTYRHDRGSFPLTSAEVVAFRASDAAERQVGRRKRIYPARGAGGRSAAARIDDRRE